jgi:hypothetical protein
LQLRLPGNQVIGLIIAPDPVLRLPVAGGKQGNDLITAAPDPGGRSVFGVADVLGDGVAIRSHSRILSDTRAKSSALLICHQDRPRTIVSRTATPARLTVFLFLA